MLPTLLSIAGEAMPPEYSGLNLLSDPIRAAGFAEMHGTGYEPEQRAPFYMWRTSDWKLISYLPGYAANARAPAQTGESYDLSNDPGEYHNLYDDPVHLQTREGLEGELMMHLALVLAGFPRQPAKAPLDLPTV